MPLDLLADIVPAKALGITVSNYGDGCLELRAPLDLNLNDKGTAFAGSIDALLALAGWGAIMLFLEERGIRADVMIVKSESEYAAPVQADMTCCATLSADNKHALLDELTARQRGRIRMQAQLYADGILCAESNSDYAAILKI